MCNGAALTIGYADPPYLGQGSKHYGDLHADAADCDDPAWHQRLIERLCDECDAWALSLSAPTLKPILNMCPDDVRVGIWVKPFVAFKKNVTRAYAYEPVILRGGRPIPPSEPTVRDWIEAPALMCPITMRRGFPGAKPAKFTQWLIEWFNMTAADRFIDYFPGSGAVTEAYQAWLASETNQHPELFGGVA